MLFSCTINFSETMASIYKDIPLTFIKHIGGNFLRDLKNPRKKYYSHRVSHLYINCASRKTKLKNDMNEVFLSFCFKKEFYTLLEKE